MKIPNLVRVHQRVYLHVAPSLTYLEQLRRDELIIITTHRSSVLFQDVTSVSTVVLCQSAATCAGVLTR